MQREKIVIDIKTDGARREVSPMLYGIFFEDINYGGDGGLYAELIANRSFEYYTREVNPPEVNPPEADATHDVHKMCWEAIGDISFSIGTRFPLSKAHSHYAHLSGETGCGLRNLGFCNEGFAVREGQVFRFSCYARNTVPVKLNIRFADSHGTLYGNRSFSLVRAAHGWSKYNLTITATGTCKQVYPELLLESEGAVDLDLISLFPADTFHDRPNGMRRDLAELLADLHPRFMRFPGGCIVEGRSFDNMYCWKDTVGALTERRTNWNRWQMEEYQINGQSSADYYQSYGIGFYEYFCLCEDLGAKPVPVINCGMTCQWHESLLAPMDELDKWIQDVLDLIEFANGSTETLWGKKRADMGHPEPFGLEYIGIGNEQWGAVYFERYEAFQRVLSEKHPEIRLITCAGWTAEGEDFDTAYRWMRENPEKAYAVDEHFYKSPEWFLENLHRYDNYDRSLPKVFAGEYAAHTDESTPKRVCNWYAALCEAAFLTGVEKNSDHVVMTCYAPLFARTGHQQWQPDLIWFDNDSAYGTPSYYVQQLFSTNIGTKLAEVSVCTEGGSICTSATLSEDSSTLYVKLVNLADTAHDVHLCIDRPVQSGTLYTLCADLDAVNSHAAPKNVAPARSRFIPQDKLHLAPYSVTVGALLLA
mgnify:CR=1 FL=1